MKIYLQQILLSTMLLIFSSCKENTYNQKIGNTQKQVEKKDTIKEIDIDYKQTIEPKKSRQKFKFITAESGLR